MPKKRNATRAEKKRKVKRQDQTAKAQARAALILDMRPDDTFMRLLAQAGDADVVSGPALGAADREYTPESIREAVFVSRT